ncbi:MAG: hypothetical protein ACKV2Q_14325 [Planctomycetaceae bacterium]
MNAREIDDQLIELKHREPFQPFEVELLDGRVISFVDPNFAINGGAAFLSDDYELVTFDWNDVRTIQLLTHKAVS